MANEMTVEGYLASLPEDRRRALEAVRATILKNLDKGYQECIQYGMIGYCVPHSVYPAGYHCDPKQPLPFAGLASKKGYMSLHMIGLYMSPEHSAEFQEAWVKAGKKLDMGAGCVRFKRLEDVPLEVVGRAFKKLPVKAYVALYGGVLARSGRGPAARKASAKPAGGAKKAAAGAKKKPAGAKKVGKKKPA